MTAHTHAIDEARHQWGIVFNDFRNACESVNTARYHVDDKQALKEEDVQRLRALIKYAQKEIDRWEASV